MTNSNSSRKPCRREPHCIVSSSSRHTHVYVEKVYHPGLCLEGKGAVVSCLCAQRGKQPAQAAADHSFSREWLCVVLTVLAFWHVRLFHEQVQLLFTNKFATCVEVSSW